MAQHWLGPFDHVRPSMANRSSCWSVLMDEIGMRFEVE